MAWKCEANIISNDQSVTAPTMIHRPPPKLVVLVGSPHSLMLGSPPENITTSPMIRLTANMMDDDTVSTRANVFVR
jgi:hypothetical protein